MYTASLVNDSETSTMAADFARLLVIVLALIGVNRVSQSPLMVPGIPPSRSSAHALVFLLLV